MAKSNQSKKSASAKGGENKDRKNGKAWKKDKFKTPRVRTPERQEKDFMIRMARAKRRQEGMARHAAELEAAKEKAAAEEAELAERKRHDPLGMAKRVHPRGQQQPAKPKNRNPRAPKKPRVIDREHAMVQIAGAILNADPVLLGRVMTEQHV